MPQTTTLRTAEVNGVQCVLFYPRPVNVAIARILRVPASPILSTPIGERLRNAMRLAQRKAA